MSDVEVKREEILTREDAAQRLAALAAALADGDEVQLTLGATTVKVHVPDEIRLEVEIEIDGNGVELEVELKWATGERATSAGPAPARRVSTQSRRARGSKR
jgi:amphi-Trp domain-containing protein